MKIKTITLLTAVLFAHSCAHHRSGRYVYQGGKWVFVKEKICFLDFDTTKFGRVDNSNYEFADDSKFIWPVPSSKRVSSRFGHRKGRHHDGIDIPAVTGSHILSSAEGEVIISGFMRGYGRVVVIKHPGGYHTVYAHTSKNLVSKGQKVDQGEVIAKVGSTGRSTGPHLHFEIRRKNRVRNPALYLANMKKSD